MPNSVLGEQYYSSQQGKGWTEAPWNFEFMEMGNQQINPSQLGVMGNFNLNQGVRPYYPLFLILGTLILVFI